MKQYICTGGCEGKSDQKGMCQTASCEKFGKPLIECSCEDDKHEQVKREDKNRQSQ